MLLTRKPRESVAFFILKEKSHEPYRPSTQESDRYHFHYF